MIQIYTGEGKGKTTASVGLAVRASKTKKVLFIQVIKSGKSSEIFVLDNIPNIKVLSFGEGQRIRSDNENSIEKENTRKAIRFIEENYKDHDIIIIDELITAVNLGLIKEDKVLSLINKMPDKKELVLTGRGATEKLIKRADLVTEMKKVKHYYDKGVKARKGIES